MLHEILSWCEGFIRKRKELVILEIIIVALMLPIAVCVTPHPVLDHIAFIIVDILAMWLAIDKVYNL